MKLKEGVNVCVGRKTWSGEIPEKVFDAISEEWTAEKKAEFRREFGDTSTKVELSPVGEIKSTMEKVSSTKGSKKEK